MLRNGDGAANFSRRGGAGQSSNDPETRRNFVGGKTVAAQLAHGIQVRVWFVQDDVSFDDFAKMRMDAPVNARLTDRWVAVEHRFDFFREDFASGDVNNRCLAPDEI